MLVIYPYREHGTWVFDDEKVGLVREPFVAGVPAMIDRLLGKAGIAPELAGKGFRMIFSANPFPGAEAHLELVRGESGGNWYRWAEHPDEGWLCPALFKYFEEAPEHIYVKAEAL